MGPRFQFALLAFWTLMSLPELVNTCLSSPSCMKSFKKQKEFQEAIKREDKDAVCRHLSVKLHCLHLAANACRHQNTSGHEDTTSLARALQKIEEMQGKFETNCPGYSYENPSNGGVPAQTTAPRQFALTVAIATALVISPSAFTILHSGA